MKPIYLFALTALVSIQAMAVPIAVIDSGTDIRHSALNSRIWNNPLDPDDAVDNDGNDLVDDSYGWNFAEGDHRLINKKLIGTFPREVYRFFDIQLKVITGTATQEEIEWMKALVKDPKMLAQLSSFGNFIHGTHVAGITSRDAPGAKVMTLKILPTRAAQYLERQQQRAQKEAKGFSATESVLRAGLAYLGKSQAKTFGPILSYVKGHGARVANCSFGSSIPALKPTFKALFEKILRRSLTDEETSNFIAVMIGQMNASLEPLYSQAKQTLFVFAAGNDGSNNDLQIVSPANIHLENTITVAATVGSTELARFSNFGALQVDVAAPGVGVVSSIPGEETLALSGTSQAAPFVSNIAGRILDVNWTLTTYEVKRLIMGTVDYKDFLRDKVRTGGLVNADRAVLAAELTKRMTVEEAIHEARAQVADFVDPTPASSQAYESFMLPMFPLVE